MAAISLARSAGCAKVAPTTTPMILSVARAAFVARADAAADRAMRRPMAAMPTSLIAASCFLVAHGVAAPACRAEVFFNWDLSTSRQYLDGLTPDRRDAEIEAGRTALFTARHPIVDLTSVSLLSAAWDDMAAPAADFTTDRYTEAKARFDALRSGEQNVGAEIVIPLDSQARAFARHRAADCLLAREC